MSNPDAKDPIAESAKFAPGSATPTAPDEAKIRKISSDSRNGAPRQWTPGDPGKLDVSDGREAGVHEPLFFDRDGNQTSGPA